MGSQSHPFTTITAFAELSRSGVNENVCIGIAKLLATTNSMELFTAIGFLLSKPGIAEILANGPKPTPSSKESRPVFAAQSMKYGADNHPDLPPIGIKVEMDKQLEEELRMRQGLPEGTALGWDPDKKAWVPLDPDLRDRLNL